MDTAEAELLGGEEVDTAEAELLGGEEEGDISWSQVRQSWTASDALKCWCLPLRVSTAGTVAVFGSTLSVQEASHDLYSTHSSLHNCNATIMYQAEVQDKWPEEGPHAATGLSVQWPCWPELPEPLGAGVQ